MYQQLETQRLRRLSESLLEKSQWYVGSGRRKSLILAASQLSGHNFATHFEKLYAELCGLEDAYVGDEPLPTFRKGMNSTDQVFENGLEPIDIVKVSARRSIEAFNAWKFKLNPTDEHSEGFWCAVTLNELRSGVIGKPWWMLGDHYNYSEDMVKSMVNKAVRDDDRNIAEKLVRNLVRHMGAGATSNMYRSKRGLYCDCSLARLYWLGKLASKVAISAMEAAEVLESDWSDFTAKHFKKSAVTTPETATFYMYKAGETSVNAIVSLSDDDAQGNLSKLLPDTKDGPALGIAKVAGIKSS